MLTTTETKKLTSDEKESLKFFLEALQKGDYSSVEDEIKKALESC